MTTTVGIRELIRNSNILDNYDYIEVKDKKTDTCKGLFISPKYADEIKKLLDDKLDKNRQKKLDRFMKYAGHSEIYQRFDNLTSSQIKEKIIKEKYDK